MDPKFGQRGRKLINYRPGVLLYASQYSPNFQVLIFEGPLPAVAQGRNLRSGFYSPPLLPGAFNLLSPIRFDYTQSQRWVQNTACTYKARGEQPAMVSNSGRQPP